MTYEATNFDNLLGTKGFSDKLLQAHFKLYQGYVANTNKVAELLADMAKSGKIGTPAYAELKRRFGWEFNGMRLHELYFGNLTKEPSAVNKKSAFMKQLEQDFGSFPEWEADFKGTGALRGIGWVILAYDPLGKKLFNTWINEHDVGHLAGAVPLLVMDVFEHAFVMDYDMNRGEYINAFFEAINWAAVEARFKE